MSSSVSRSTQKDVITPHLVERPKAVNEKWYSI